MSAVRNGSVIDTSMGLTPLEGFVLYGHLPSILCCSGYASLPHSMCKLLCLTLMLFAHRLMMSTRCGDTDPSVVIYLAQHCGMAVADIDKLMNKQASQPCREHCCDVTLSRECLVNAGMPSQTWRC